ncbi:MAG: hypothetical protein P8H30_06040, partial [Luminiphilus sp.]|nr:hypothetical protein [Luminiphilus sp.]
MHSDDVAEQDGEICVHSSAQISAVCFHHLQYLETGHTKLGTAGAKGDYFYGGVLRFWRSYHAACEVEAGTLAPSP